VILCKYTGMSKIKILFLTIVLLTLANTAQAITLKDSGPITVSSNGQVVENLRITSSGTGITVNGKSDVVIRNVEIHHVGGYGINFISSPNILIEDVAIVHDGAPTMGANDSANRINIRGESSADVVIRRVRLTRGSSGIYLFNSDNARLSFIEGHDFRGPFPRGQLVQANKSDNGILEDFSSENPQATSWPEDIVSIYNSVNWSVRRGLVDGNNSTNGVGIMYEQDDGRTSNGLIEDVDAIRQGNGNFYAYPGFNVTFRRTRARETICTDQGRGLPASGSLSWGGGPGSLGLRIEDSSYFALCKPQNLVWDRSSFTVIDLREENFTPRKPIQLIFPWESGGPPPLPTPGTKGDLNSDGKVDVTDLGILLSNWGGGGSADINGDGVVDVVDLGVMLSDWSG